MKKLPRSKIKTIIIIVTLIVLSNQIKVALDLGGNDLVPVYENKVLSNKFYLPNFPNSCSNINLFTIM